MRTVFPSQRVAEQRQRWWDARKAALEKLLGPCDGTIYYAPPPLHRQGFADVLRFRQFGPPGTITYATCDLVGNKNQVANKWGNYELVMSLRNENDWAPSLLSRLAIYTQQATLQPGDTMDLGDSRPADSTITALIFSRPDPPADTFNVLGVAANLILCMGITFEEFDACKNFGSGVMLRMLREQNVFPFTELTRNSISGI